MADLLADIWGVDVQNARPLGGFGLSPSKLTLQNCNDATDGESFKQVRV
jgi:hypothetical protein